MTKRATAAAVLAATALLGPAPQAAAAPAAAPAAVPQPLAAGAEDRAAAARAAGAPDTLAVLARFFAREGGPGAAAAAGKPRIEGEPVEVRHLSPDFVAGRPGAPVSRLEFLAGRAVAADGRQAAVWTARTGSGWQVVNIADGDDEFRYARLGAERMPGGTVFREPQIDAWYVAGGGRVLPLDEDAVRAVGERGTALAAYRARVAAAYGDKLPGSAYARDGRAGGYDEAAPARPDGTPAAAAGAAGAALAAALGVLAVRRRRLRRRTG
ncbi:hypothetical protein [Streptomyces toxytricini]|uniref:hypothetical protein n=1 Tax=Streptomyces toxytricini TaxID=67369 RepID=UPI0034331138